MRLPLKFGALIQLTSSPAEFHHLRSSFSCFVFGDTEDGIKELVAIEGGYRESELSWSQVLLNLQGRGLELGSKLSVGDSALCWDGRYVSLLKTLASTNLLVLDDWGLKSFSAEQQYVLNNTELIRTPCAHALKNLRVPNHMSTELPSDAAQLDLPNLVESLFFELFAKTATKPSALNCHSHPSRLKSAFLRKHQLPRGAPPLRPLISLT